MSFLRAHPTMSRRFALALLLLAAFVMRVWNLNWDEGTHQHPDERYWSMVTAELSNTSLSGYFDSSSSTLNPYNLPDRNTWVYGTFPLFTTKAVASFLTDGPFPAKAIVTTADALGIDLRTDGIDDFDSGYNANLIGRFLSALIDTGTVLLVYLLGRNLFNRRVGFVAAILVAFTVLHIQYAHFYGSEPWVTFFVTAGLLTSVRIAQGDLRWRIAIGTGFLLGLAMASKLIAAAALLIPATAIAIAIAPNINKLIQKRRQQPAKQASHFRNRALTATATAVLLAILILRPSFLSVALILLLTITVIAVVLIVIGKTDRTTIKRPLCRYQPTYPIRRAGAHKQEEPLWLLPVRGVFIGLVVLSATAITYRVFQPYAFDGIATLDERFTQDLNLLKGFNSGENIPWVVQWVGRTPLLYPLQSAFWWGMGPALGIAVVVGLWRSINEIIRRQRWILLVPLVFLVVILGLVTGQFNPLIRYLLPAYPIAVTLGAFGIVWLWDAGRERRTSASARFRTIASAQQVLAGALLLATIVWGLAFVNGVYNNKHPRLEASIWMAENLPDGATVSTQIWDDPLPLNIPQTADTSFTQIAFDLFQADAAVNSKSITKVDQLITNLEKVDYVIEASNRLYDSIPRIPAKYPATTKYYETLFDGRLGFETIATFQTPPTLFGIEIPDHFAEETFTVYDHPTVTIWAKTDRFSPERARALLNPAKAAVAPDIIPREAATNALQLTPAENDAISTGETFDEQFKDGGVFGSLPWFWWLLWLQIAALVVLPWTTMLFSGLPDKGYGLSKVIGFLTVGLGTWLAVAWNLMSFGSGMIWACFATVALVGIALWRRHAERMSQVLSDTRSTWIASEALFLAVFGLTLWMRSANPDLWEPILGGEKPMEMAYLTAIARASELPVPDPWFAGGYMNYYYFGWYLLTVPIRAMQILPEVGFNLGVATYAALTAVTAFSIVQNLIAVSQNRWANKQATTFNAPIRTGLLGVLLLLGIGNLDAIRLHYSRVSLVNEWDIGTNVPILSHIITFAGGNWAWARGASLERFDWWQPSRVNRGNFDITEFPYFTFLFGDLHPHMMGLVFIGLIISLAISYLIASHRADSRRAVLLAVGLGIASGVARMVNTWDLPSIALLTVTTILLGRLLSPIAALGDDQRSRGILAILATAGLGAGMSYFGGPGKVLLITFGGLGVLSALCLFASSRIRLRFLSFTRHTAAAAITHVVVFWPFLRDTETFDTGLQSAADHSPLDDFLIHWGIFLAIAMFLSTALFIDSSRKRKAGEFQPRPLRNALRAPPPWKGVWLGLASGIVLFGGFVVNGPAAISIAGVMIFGRFLLIEVHRENPDFGRLVAVGLFTLGFAITGGVEIATVQNDIARMNTVFKFWLQAWIYLSLASGFAIWQVGRVVSEMPQRVERRFKGTKDDLSQGRSWQTNLWRGIVGITLVAGLAYPLLATRTRLQTRFTNLPLTLNGLAYLESDPVLSTINEAGNEIRVPIGDDLPIIEWIRANVGGTPTIVEWAGRPYDWNGRIAVYTGLPTVIGWDWHQKQQRWSFQSMVDQRVNEVQALFTVANQKSVTAFLQAYGVSYVVVGTQERRFGTPEAIAAFARHPALEAVFQKDLNVIYRVNSDNLWPEIDLEKLEFRNAGAS